MIAETYREQVDGATLFVTEVFKKKGGKQQTQDSNSGYKTVSHIIVFQLVHTVEFCGTNGDIRN